MRESYFYRNRIERTKPNEAVNLFLNPPKALAKADSLGGPLKTIFEYQGFE